MARRVRIGTLRHLDSWRFWVLVAYFALAFFGVLLWLLFGRTAREQAARDTQTRVANVSQVQACFTAAHNLPVAVGFVATQRALIDSSITTAEQSLAATSPDDPLRAVRIRSIARLERAKKSVNALYELIERQTPRRAKCVKLARQRNVPVPPTQRRN